MSDKTNSFSVSASLVEDTIQKEGFTSKELLVLLVLALMQFTFIVDYILLMPLGPQIMMALDMTAQQFSYLISFYTFSAAISGFLASFIIDKFDRKRAILICYLGFTLGPLVTTYADSYNTLLIARIFSGAFGGVLTALIMTILGDTMEVSKLGRGTSFILSANAVASILGIPAAMVLVHQGSWKTPFYIMLGLNTVILLNGIAFIPSIKKHLDPTVRNIQAKKLMAFIKNPNFIWPLTFMSLLTLAGGFTILPFLSTYVTHNFQFSVKDISLLFFLGGIGSFVTAPLAGSLSDKFGKQNVFLWLNFLSIIPIMLLTVFPLQDKSVIISVTSLFFMFSTARHVSGMALINSRFDPQIRGRFISLNSSIQLFAGSLGTLLAGFLLVEENNLIYNFDLVGIIAISATIICIFTAFVLDE